jgi:hypothetical protein
VTVRALRGRRTVKTWRARTVGANRLVRLRLPSERIGRGEVRVRLTVVAAGRTVTRTVVARRL